MALNLLPFNQRVITYTQYKLLIMGVKLLTLYQGSILRKDTGRQYKHQLTQKISSFRATETDTCWILWATYMLQTIQPKSF